MLVAGREQADVRETPKSVSKNPNCSSLVLVKKVPLICLNCRV